VSMNRFEDKITVDDILEETLDSLGITVTKSSKRQLIEYITGLLRWNKRTNLTGASDEAALIRGPLFDALTLIPVLESSGTLVDVGAGGGLPGIPAALIRGNVDITLVEPRSRRATFLKHICHKLSLNLEVVQCKDAELKSAQWHGAVAQAVWSPKEWIPRGLRLVHNDGVVYVLSSTEVTKDIVPVGAVIEKSTFVERPMDKAPRYTARIRNGNSLVPR